MKKTRIITFASWVMLFLLTSCNSNSIYFDMELQSVVRCKGVISQLYLKSKDGKENLLFSVSPGKKGSKLFNFKNKEYSIEVLYSDYHLDLQDFKLRPNTEYEIIDHSNGDAADGKLLIKTDRNGFIIYADKTSCN